MWRASHFVRRSLPLTKCTRREECPPTSLGLGLSKLELAVDEVSPLRRRSLPPPTSNFWSRKGYEIHISSKLEVSGTQASPAERLRLRRLRV
uniref:Unclassified n=1 Tax=Fusarium pseudograminearum CS5834 TaxID=1318459 RepID=W1IB35_FUSPS|nr:unclassified [Fusarium pseudograminearum CS5834]CDX48204.1 unclassified [Fusarium pseudograminearum CS5834]